MLYGAVHLKRNIHTCWTKKRVWRNCQHLCILGIVFMAGCRSLTKVIRKDIYVLIHGEINQS